MVALWTVYGFRPELGERAKEPFASLARPGEFWPILVAFVAVGGAVWALSGTFRISGEPDSGGEVRLSPLAAALLGPSALIMGIASYWPCSGEESSFWASLRRMFEVFQGNLSEPFGAVSGCPTSLPQSLEAASLFAHVTIALSLGLAVAYIFKHSIDRIRAYTARQVVIFSGLGEETIEAARAVRNNLTRRQRLVFLDAGPEINRTRALAREIGALVLSLDATDDEAVESFIRARGKRGVQGIYLLSPESAQNVRVLGTFLSANTVGATCELPGRVVVRVDNPWHAEDWRRKQMTAHPGWLFDAISARAVAARHVISMLKRHDPVVSHVVLTGENAFDLAVLSELSFEHRVDEFLGCVSDEAAAEWNADPSHTSSYHPYQKRVPRAVLVGPNAGVAAEHFRDQLARFGISNPEDILDLHNDEDAEQAMERLLADGHSPALVVNERSERDATFLAVRHPRWTIIGWDPKMHGVTEEPLLGGLYLVGSTLKPVPGFGLDIWDRLGSVQHQAYLLKFLGGVFVQRDTKRGDWEELSAFARESNVRAFAVFTRAIGSLPRPRTFATDLRPDGVQRPAPLVDVSDVGELAQREHESWVKHHEENGFRYGKVRKGMRHPDIVQWDALCDEEKKKDFANVEATNELLRSLGFVLTDAK
jgi:hypothetical protein